MKKAKKTYKIYISSPAGLSYTGVWTNDEDEAKRLCNMYNSQDDNPYCSHVYKEV